MIIVIHIKIIILHTFRGSILVRHLQNTSLHWATVNPKISFYDSKCNQSAGHCITDKYIHNHYIQNDN